MDFYRNLVLAYLEEDNVKRAYFRIIPLLSDNGAKSEDLRSLWPDLGSLRIVPDKDERVYFKDRMRHMGHYCVIDMRGISAEANKIRTNKNYAADSEELNQYVIYSDVIKDIPSDSFLEIVEEAALPAEGIAPTSITPCLGILQDNRIVKLYDQVNGWTSLPEGYESFTAITITSPDGATHQLVCRPDKLFALAATAMASNQPAEKAAEDTTVAEPSDKKSEPSAFTCPVDPAQNTIQPSEEALKSAAVRPRNRSQRYITEQWEVVKNTPLSACLAKNADPKGLQNPLSDIGERFTEAWQNPLLRPRLAQFLRGLPGMAQYMMPTPSGGNRTALQHALLERINALEEERLSVLMALHEAQKSLEAFREKAASEQTKQHQAELAQLKTDIEEATACKDALLTQLNNLQAQRDVLQREILQLQEKVLPSALAKALCEAKMVNAVQGNALLLSKRNGAPESLDSIRNRCIQVACASYANYNKEIAMVMLALISSCERFALVSATPASTRTMVENAVTLLGWKSGFGYLSPTTHEPIQLSPDSGNTPLLVYTDRHDLPRFPAVSCAIIAQDMQAIRQSSAYQMDQCPILVMKELPSIPLLPSDCAGQPLALDAIAAIPHSTCADSVAFLSAIMDFVPPLSGRAMTELYRFIDVMTALLDGNFARACDWAILMWIMPGLSTEADHAALKELLLEYPMSCSLLS